VTRATRAVAAATLALSIALGAGACTSLVGDFQISEKACVYDLECPNTTQCAVPTCSDHLCTSTPVARGTECTPGCGYQMCGPCQSFSGCGRCDGDGHCVVCESPTQCSIPPPECHSADDCPAHAACAKTTHQCCLLSPAECATDDDCCTKHCAGGTCDCLTGAEGVPCKADENCCSNKCVDQLCAP
jgi:hypothetical protein